MNLLDKNAISQYLRDKTGKTISAFSKEVGVSRKEIYAAIGGEGSQRVRIIIAKAVSLPPSVIWNQNDVITKTIDDIHYLNLVK